MKEQILKLRSEGKTYDQIRDILGCSKSTISYYCGEGQKEKTRIRRNKSRKNNKQKLIDYKKTLECEICKEDRWYVLDFHHPDPSKKEGGVSDLMSAYGYKKAMEEVKKCQVLCSNCHRQVHYDLSNN